MTRLLLSLFIVGHSRPSLGDRVGAEAAEIALGSQATYATAAPIQRARSTSFNAARRPIPWWSLTPKASICAPGAADSSAIRTASGGQGRHHLVHRQRQSPGV